MEKTKHVVLVSGMSGAGKSTAMSILEDMGYHVIENFPIQLLSLLVDMIETSTDPRYSYIALSTSAADFPVFLRTLKGQGIEVRVMFLDAADSVLIHRYKQTRRIHPLLLSNTANTLEEAIAVERQMLSQTNNSSFVTIDTSFTSAHDIKQMIEQYFSKDAAPSFSISFVSFGYKYGLPLEADLVIDVRFMPNPFYIEELRPQTGLDKAVSDYVFSFQQTKDFLKRLEELLAFTLPLYAEEGKTSLVIAVGCTGGHHRSVAVTHALAEFIAGQGYQVAENHRDMTRGG